MKVRNLKMSVVWLRLGLVGVRSRFGVVMVRVRAWVGLQSLPPHSVEILKACG